jgi:hypothetical protein
MSEHFLNRSQVCSSLQEVRSKRMTQQMRVNPVWVEPGLLGELPQDQERAGAGQGAAARVQEELGPVRPRAR